MTVLNTETNEWVKQILDFTVLKPDALKDEEVLNARKQQEERDVLEEAKATGMPERYLVSTFENYEGNPQAVEIIKQYAEKSKKVYLGVLVLLGGNGTGKTHLACSLLHANKNGKYIDMPSLEIEIECSRDFSAKQNKADVLSKYTKTPLLIMDEVGRFQNAQAEKQALYYIINARYNKKLNTVLISNLNTKDLKEYMGNATSDRISEKRVLVELSGESYRRKNK